MGRDLDEKEQEKEDATVLQVDEQDSSILWWREGETQEGTNALEADEQGINISQHNHALGKDVSLHSPGEAAAQLQDEDEDNRPLLNARQGQLPINLHGLLEMESDQEV